MSTASWLRELGAVRPMAPVSNHVLVLGKWSEGHYTIEWNKKRSRKDWVADINGVRQITIPESEEWIVFGIPTARPLTREDCERILRAVEGE